MFEHRTKPLLPRKVFVVRVLFSLALALGIIEGRELRIVAPVHPAIEPGERRIGICRPHAGEPARQCRIERMKPLSRSFSGASKIWTGGPDSAITPSTGRSTSSSGR